MLCELTDDTCSGDCECILKKFLLSLHPSPRLLIQLKCVERFIKDKEKETGETMDWNEAIDLWAKEGYAEKFAEIYEEGISYKEIYSTITS